MTFYVLNQVKLVPENAGVAVFDLRDRALEKGDCYCVVEWHHIRTIKARWDAGYAWHLCLPAYHLEKKVVLAIVACADELLA